MKQQSVRSLPNVIARRIIVTGDEFTSTTQTCHLGAPHPPCATPNDLGVVPALLTRRARIGPILIPLPLLHPGLHRLRRGPTPTTPPEDVLAVGAVGVPQGAVPSPLGCIPLRVAGYMRIPNQRAEPNCGSSRIVGCQELASQAQVVLSDGTGSVALEQNEEGGDNEGGTGGAAWFDHGQPWVRDRVECWLDTPCHWDHVLYIVSRQWLVGDFWTWCWKVSNFQLKCGGTHVR